MKLLYNDMEITCTPDEFEDLVIRGLLPGREKLSNINDNDDWINQFWERFPKERNIPPVTCQSVETYDQYKSVCTSNVSISQEQLNKLNAIVNKDEQST